MTPVDDSFEGASYWPHTLQVTKAVRASTQEVWEALTEPEAVRQWLGEMCPPLCVGELTNLDFGDGDFFTLEVLRINPPQDLQYIWRSLGIGPKETLTWQIIPKGEGCLVTVTHNAPPCATETTRVLRKDWLDHTNRLEEFLRTGRPARYPWCREFYASTELPGHIQSLWEHLLASTVQTLWFPLHSSFPDNGISFPIKDGAEPFELQITDFMSDPQNYALSFRLMHKNWLHPTNCYLNLYPRGQDVMLVVRHMGWEAISFDSEYQKQQRMRFAALWHKSLLHFTFSYVRRWKIPIISPVELQAWIGQPNFFVFDSNRITLWEQGHIPGAIFIGQEAIAPELLPPDKEATLVFYCRDSM